ncbi:MAG TPA: NADH-quinone oxidoreductase subunit NuoN [Amaricoccus sp.]|uniref:NADH-quinone oxidoreductase subunit NuoN n=1 Tax=Amaricoccus sp. TaxID=1872485 RepID=UPI002C433A99|nr:NADH-quinone oxidoreductase subunit NuoN [Amaricoccus sp.]HMQ94199.1 NADH-quinone oxidoreductase subunit NuoN [Amaricoccus sp.]HMR53576.1 NADH-quinone oxidoreductase subunit NuoN [Amaricoccus sp.]HMR61662.1 NADH-quinone oxidoreductase subunit NuoN [Amaricoccus sp.]HMU00587.1 NADH-quinone oxidoreductase subunit NuoN [Amaricoccus sp.]
MLAHNLSVVAPELVLAVFAMAALMWGAYSRRRDPSGTILWAATAMLVLAGLFVGFQPEGARTAFDDSFISDGFARFAKVVILFGAAAALAMSGEYLKRTEMLKFEYPVLIVFSVIGMMTMVSAMDLIVLYMGLELQSLSLYVVAAFRRDSLRSTEAGLKYFVLGALSSGLLLYGASLTYGYSGTTAFAGISQAVGEGPLSLGLIFGLVFLAAGIAFKVSAAPFHMWTPDVYEGSPTPVTAFFATAPKAAAAAMFARLLYDAFGGAVSEWQQILAFLSVASMFLGAVAAIGQRNIKRLMAYSSIGHMGYALMGLAAGTEQGAQALLIYIAIYVTMNVGVFAFILNMQRDGKPVTDIGALGLYSRVEPARAAALAVLLFSLAGVPPLVGFFGKFYVLMAAVDAGLIWLAVAGAVASVIGAFYYLRIVYLMYFGEAAPPLEGAMPVMHWALLGGSALAMVLGVVNLFGVETLAASAAATLVQ